MRRADALRDQLEQDIVTGALRPGERLDEQSLAARFGVSRTPIREALMQLASSGSGRAAASARRLRRLAQPAGGDRALRGDGGARRRLRRPGGPADDRRGAARAPGGPRGLRTRGAGRGRRRLLLCQRALPPDHLRRASHNTYLAEQARQLHDRLKPYRRLQLRARSRVAGSLAEHQAIVDAILAGDGERAERALKDHILIQGERLSDFIATFAAAEVA